MAQTARTQIKRSIYIYNIGIWEDKIGMCEPKIGVCGPKIGVCEPKIGMCGPIIDIWGRGSSYSRPLLGEALVGT